MPHYLFATVRRVQGADADEAFEHLAAEAGDRPEPGEDGVLFITDPLSVAGELLPALLRAGLDLDGIGWTEPPRADRRHPLATWTPDETDALIQAEMRDVDEAVARGDL